MSIFGLSLAFDAIYLIIALVQVGHCIHLLRLSTPLKSTTYLLLAGSIIYVAAWTTSLVGDVGANGLGGIQVTTSTPNVAIRLVADSVTTAFVGSLLSTIGFALISAAIFRAIASAGDGKMKTQLWIGIGLTTFLALLDIASLSLSYNYKLAFLNHPPPVPFQHDNTSTIFSKAVFSLGLGIPAVVFKIAFLVILGKVASLHKEHPSLHIVRKFIFPAFIFQIVLAIIDAILIGVLGSTLPELYFIFMSMLVSAVEPLIAGCLLRVAYTWSGELYQKAQGSMTSIEEQK